MRYRSFFRQYNLGIISFRPILLLIVCCSLLGSIEAARRKKHIRNKSLYDSFANHNKNIWVLEGQSEINFGRLAFVGEKKSFCRSKIGFIGQDYNLQLLLNCGLKAGEFNIDLLQKDTQLSSISLLLKWLDNDGEGEVEITFTNYRSGEPVVKKMTVQDLKTNQWQKLRFQKTAHRVVFSVNDEKIFEFIWRDDIFLAMSSSTTGEVLVDDFMFTYPYHSYHILDSLSLPNYGQPLGGWKTSTGVWNPIFLPKSRQKVIAQTSSVPALLYFNEYAGGDYEISVDCRLEQGKIIGIGIVDLEREEQYRFVMESENSVGLRFEYVDDEKVKLLDRSEVTIFPGVWNKVKFKVWNGTCSVWFDDEPIFEYIKIPSGLKPCLLTSGTQTGLFRNLTLKEENYLESKSKVNSMSEYSITDQGDWQKEFNLRIKNSGDAPAEINLEHLSRYSDYRLTSDLKLNAANKHVVFEFSSGLNRVEWHIVQQEKKWYFLILVKELGKRQEVPINSKLQKLLFNAFNQDLFVVQLKEISEELAKETVKFNILKNGGTHHRLRCMINGESFGEIDMQAKGAFHSVLRSYGILEFQNVVIKSFSRDGAVWLKVQNPSVGFAVESGVLTVNGGTYDERSLSEGNSFSFSPFIYENGKMVVDLKPREGRGKVGFFLADITGEVYEIGSLALSEGEESVWINSGNETKRIKADKKSQQLLYFTRFGQQLEIYTDDQLLETIQLDNSSPMKLFLTRLSGSFVVNGSKVQYRAANKSIDFKNKDWLKTTMIPVNVNYDLSKRLEANDWHGLSMVVRENDSDHFELKAKLPVRFALNLEVDYRRLKNLDFEHDIRLKTLEDEIDLKIFQLEEGIELMLTIAGDVKFREPYLSKKINYDLLYDGEKIYLYTNGTLIGEEKYFNKSKWLLDMRIKGNNGDFIRVTEINWSHF